MHRAVAEVMRPAQEYARATILQVDIVGYTSTCSKTTPGKVAKWMSKVHMIIDQVRCPQKWMRGSIYGWLTLRGRAGFGGVLYPEAGD